MNFDNRSSLGENDTHVVDISGNGNDGTVTGATGTGIGDGETNSTTIILNGCQQAGDAAIVATAYMGPTDNTSGWFLPSRDELSLMYLFRQSIGGFTLSSYWSSSEVDGNNAWTVNFFSGDHRFLAKLNVPTNVRAVRAF